MTVAKFLAISVSRSQVYKSLVGETELIRSNMFFLGVIAAFLFRFFSFIVILRVSIYLVSGTQVSFRCSLES